MTNQINCGLCLEVSGQRAAACGDDYGRLVDAGTNIILTSDDFIVIPSVGPLNDTHAMLIPKLHVNNFSELSKKQIHDGFKILQRLQNHIREKTGKNLIFFESGAGRLTSHSGGCIIHAHIHCITESQNFENHLKEEVKLTPITKYDYSMADKKKGYLWYQDAQELQFLCNSPLLPSQFMRFIYAKFTKESSSWNWRNNINYPCILRVLETYQGIK